MRFLGNVLATLVGLFIFCMLFFFGIVFIAAISGGDSEGVSIENNSVIELNLEDVTNDYVGKYKDPLITLLEEGDKVGLIDVIHAIETAKKDDDIKGISILNSNSAIGMAQRKALRNALENFKKSGKFVMSYANSYSQKEYYLSSVANSIYINPVGEMDFRGLSAEIMFFKDFQEKSGIKAEVIRHGKYKSAVEPFLENKMSDANREQLSSLLNSVWDAAISDISKSRNISEIKLNEIANGLLARTPQMAKAQKLVDHIAYEDVYHNEIKKALKIDADTDYKKVSIIEYTHKTVTTAIKTVAKDKIAIIYAQGEIRGGEGDVDVIGEGAMRRSLSDARKDKNVKGIVLRIDSPGGDAFTSDLIWREIELTKKVKPVVVSMGNYAASGGYYIACNANQIFAENNTITGSIGVFGILPNFTQIASKMGLHSEQVKTHENAAKYSPFLPLDEKFKAVTQESVEQVYKTFVSHVAQGRKMSFTQVDTIAQGRVWSGSEALKIGLVDKIGGIDAAIKMAAKLGKTNSYSTQNYPEFEKSFNEIIKNLPMTKLKETFIKEEIGTENYLILNKVKRVQAQKGVQASLPFEISIR
jgi:protease IV